MGSGARVSLVAYVYNYADYLGDVLRSVQAQTYREFELVVVDDGSTDGTAELVRGLGDPRVRYVRQDHRGRAHLDETFNRCMAEAKGDLIAIVNGDDRLDPGKIEGQVAQFAGSPELDVSFHDADFMDACGRPIPGSFRPWVDAETLALGRLGPAMFRQNLIPNPTVMFRRRVFDRIGPQQFGWVHDYDFWLRAAVAGCRFRYSSERWIRYRVHERSHSTSSVRADTLRTESRRMRCARRAELSIEQLYPEIRACADASAARVDAHVELAVLLASGADPLLDLAAHELDAALELAPQSALALHDLAVVDLLRGNVERGCAELETLVRATDSPVARENLRVVRSGGAGALTFATPDPVGSELMRLRRSPPSAPHEPQTTDARVAGARAQRLAVDALLRS